MAMEALQPPAANGENNNALPAPRVRHGLSPSSTGIVVFSGGSAANSLVDVFEAVRAANGSSLNYVIPISDNGGSTSEIIRFFGGPGIGDVRSRLVRLIPDDGSPESAAIKLLFNHRLAKLPDAARSEWFDLLEASHPLWTDISSPKRELIRSYLNSFNLETVKRMRPSSRFDFSRASVGNLFLTGARLLTGSFEAAIYLLSSLCAVPTDRVAVVPALNTNFAHHIAAGLANGDVITGQYDISHQSLATAADHTAASSIREIEHHDRIEDANLPGSLPALRRPTIEILHEQELDLPARIDRLWYINPYGQEMHIPANPRVLDAIGASSTVIYSIGSLFTSLIPSLVLKGVGDAVANPLVRNKILILNGTLDRETGPSTEPMTGFDFVRAVANACADSRGLPPPAEEDYSRYVSHLIYLEDPLSPVVDKQRLRGIGIDCRRVYGAKDGAGRGGRYDAKGLTQMLSLIVGQQTAQLGRSRRNTLEG